MVDFQITSFLFFSQLRTILIFCGACLRGFFTLKKNLLRQFPFAIDKQKKKKKFLHFTCETRAVEKLLVARQHINTNGHPVSFALCLGDCRPD
jgi:hypothetical protein